ncbi:hypothetical protein B5G20_07375 [Collinsella sp. An7]|nr:hypothetical protein B5G20_07375 [Collinsella sp. An7]
MPWGSTRARSGIHPRSRFSMRTRRFTNRAGSTQSHHIYSGKLSGATAQKVAPFSFSSCQMTPHRKDQKPNQRDDFVFPKSIKFSSKPQVDRHICAGYSPCCPEGRAWRTAERTSLELEPSLAQKEDRKEQEVSEAISTDAEARLPLPTLLHLPLLLDSDQTAELLNVSPRTITRLCKKGKIRAVQVGGQWRVNRDELLKQFGIA